VPRGMETILVVEDKPGMRAVALAQLMDLGCSVLQAENGKTALGVIKEHPEISLLFSDVVMPGGMSGYDLAQAARRVRPDLKILLSSGFTSKTLIRANGEAEELELPNKPFRMSDLAVKLRQILGGAERPLAAPPASNSGSSLSRGVRHRQPGAPRAAWFRPSGGRREIINHCSSFYD
jgi:CheY-like chemotaxis protein